MSSISISRFSASSQASSRLSWELYCDGMNTPVTFSFPTASTATAATREESMPPERPMTAALNPAFRVHDCALAVKDQFVLSAYRVDVDDKYIVFSRPQGKHLCSFPALALVIGRCVDRHDGLCAGERLQTGRAVGKPDVLAHVYADVHAFDAQHGITIAGLEVTILVEHAIVRQKHLMVNISELAVVQDRRRVIDVFVRVHEPDNGGDPRGRLRDLPERAKVVFHELRLEHKVFGRIAGHGQFGKRDDICAELPGAHYILDDLVPVAREVAERGIDLGHGDTDGTHVTP